MEKVLGTRLVNSDVHAHSYHLRGTFRRGGGGAVWMELPVGFRSQGRVR